MDNQELIIDTINSFNEYLLKLPKGCNEIANLLRVNNIPEALISIMNFTEGTMWLVKVNDLLIKSGVEYNLQSDRINDFLNEINTGLQIQDYVLVADIFEYEIAPFFEESEGIKGLEV